MKEGADSRSRQAVLGYALSITNRALGIQLFGSPRELVDELRNRSLDIGTALGHRETEIAATEVLKSLPHLSFSGGPHAEKVLELLDAIRASGSKTVSALLDSDPDALMSDGAAAVLLLAVVSTGRVDLIESLLGRGARVDATGDFDMTALHWAAALGDAAAVGTLLEAGADTQRRTWFYVSASELGTINRHDAVARLMATRQGMSPKAFSLDVVIDRMKADRLRPRLFH